jgi:hypothetical protein
VVYDEADSPVADSAVPSDANNTAEAAGSIDWAAGSEEVNDLLPPPKPGRSGMKHSGANESKGK